MRAWWWSITTTVSLRRNKANTYNLVSPLKWRVFRNFVFHRYFWPFFFSLFLTFKMSLYNFSISFSRIIRFVIVAPYWQFSKSRLIHLKGWCLSAPQSWNCSFSTIKVFNGLLMVVVMVKLESTKHNCANVPTKAQCINCIANFSILDLNVESNMMLSLSSH